MPNLIQSNLVCAHYFGETKGRVTPDNYWRDVGTIDSYYQANMDLLQSIPPLDLYQNDWPIRSYQSQTPPARAVPGKSGNEGIFINSILSGGTIISGGSISHSVLSQNIFIGDESQITNSVIFDGVKIGKKVKINKCIIDKDVIVPAGEVIGEDSEKDKDRFTVSETGITVIPQGYVF